MDLDTPFPKLRVRCRLLILVLAVGTAVTVVLTLLAPPGGSRHPRAPTSEPARCTPGQQADCVGGAAQVIVPAAPASAGQQPRDKSGR